MPTVKRGDATTLTLNLGTDLSGYESATVFLRRVGADALELTGDIAAGTGGTVTVDLTETDTATVGDYRVEVEMLPGPHTYPSTGYVWLSVVEDLG